MDIVATKVCDTRVVCTCMCRGLNGPTRSNTWAPVGFLPGACRRGAMASGCIPRRGMMWAGASIPPKTRTQTSPLFGLEGGPPPPLNHKDVDSLAPPRCFGLAHRIYIFCYQAVIMPVYCSGIFIGIFQKILPCFNFCAITDLALLLLFANASCPIQWRS